MIEKHLRTLNWQPPKFINQIMWLFEPTLKSNLFWGQDFSTFFFISVPQKYWSEKTPNLKGQKKVKTSGKLKKIPHLQPPDWNYLFWMKLYSICIWAKCCMRANQPDRVSSSLVTSISCNHVAEFYGPG